MGWLIALGIITLLAVLPLGVSIRYDADGAVVKVIAGPVKITLFPRPKKQKPTKEKAEPAKTSAEKKEKKKSAQSKAESGEKPEQLKKNNGGKVTDFLPLVKIVLDFLNDFRRKLRIDRLELKLILAADDPCDLAVNYGRAWTAVGNLMPRLEQWLVIKKRNIEVECDFTASEMLVIAQLDLTITLGRILAAVIVFVFRALVEFMKIMNKRKGGAVNEPKSS